MKIVVQLSLVDLKRAGRLLMVRFSDETEAASDFLTLKAYDNVVEIIVGQTSEVLNAVVTQQGYAKLPFALLQGIARSLRFHRKRGVISIVLSHGVCELMQPSTVMRTFPFAHRTQNRIFPSQNLQNYKTSDRYNGTIAIESKPMVGTTIHVQVPFKSDSNTERAAG